MKSFILSICLSILTFSIFAQNSNVDLCEVYKQVARSENLDTITYLLALDSSQVSDYEKAELYSMKGNWLLAFGKYDGLKKIKISPSIFKEAHKYFTLAIEQNQEEIDKLTFIYRRYFLLDDYEPQYQEYDTDLHILHSNGFRSNSRSAGINILTKYDGDFWLGAEFSFFNGYRPSFKLKDNDNQIIARRKFSISTSVLTFGYTRNLQSKMSDFNATLLRLEAPLFVDVTQFGFINALGSNHWYYRPEIGIGYSVFHISAGYTVFFKNQKSKSLSNTIFSFRIKHTF